MNYKISLYIILIFNCSIFSNYAQETVTLDKSIERLIQDEQVLSLINNHIQYNSIKSGVDGYRVQIFFDSGNNSREKAVTIRSDFVSRFPTINAYVLWQQPNYKVRVGNCLTRIEAQEVLDLVKPSYLNAYIVRDVIAIPVFIQKDTIK